MSADRLLTRRGTLVAGLVFLLLSLWQAPGRISPDTKLDLTADPIGFLARATHLWSPEMPTGQVQNQAYGYLFPHGAFFALGDLLSIPPWITQRLWWAILLTAGFIGLVRLAEALGIGSYGSRLIAAAAFVASPRVVTTLGTISSETLPLMLAPWVLLPVVRAVTAPRRPRWQEAARSAVAVALMGAVNAVATVAAVSVAVLWWVGATAMRATRRQALAFGGWWALFGVAVCLWWVVPLLMLSRLSPPFLDFIESSEVTTQWTSMTEVLRGATSWTPFVSSERAAGAVLVSESAAILATGILAAAGLAGLAMRAMPGRRRWLAILVIGLAAICLGYPGALGSPIAETVRAFLDGDGAALRNVHKFDPLIRLPLVLGIAHLLARVPFASILKAPAGRLDVARSTAAAMVLVTAIVGAGSLAWTGGLAPDSSYKAIPDYWQQTADWLDENAQGTRTLIVPGAPFADQIWGLTRDEPLQALGSTPWAVRDAIPLTPPGAIRSMDVVQRALVSGQGSAALADTLTEQGIGYVVLRADLDPATSRSARPLVVADALRRSPGLTVAAQFGPKVAPPAVEGVIVDDGLRPPMPAVTIYSVGAARGVGPRLTPLEQMPRVVGGPEAIAGVNETRIRSGRPVIGTALLATDAERAGLAATSDLIVTDSPTARETDFGRVDDHSSAIRADSDPRLTKNTVADYPVDGAELVRGEWLLNNEPGQARVTTSGSASDATQPGRTSPASSTAAAFDGDPRTSWVSRGLESAVGRWLAVDFTQPHRNLAITVTTARALGPDVTSLLITTDAGSTVASGVEPGKPTRIVTPAGPTRRVEIRAIQTANSSAGNQFAIADVQLADANTDLAYSLRHRVVLPPLATGDTVASWVLHSELGSRADCTSDGDRVRCAPSLGSESETPGVFGRALSVPSDTTVTPSILLRPRAGGALSDLLQQPGTVTARGPSSVTDPRGTAAAAVDGDPATVWTAPETEATKDKKKPPPPTLTLSLPNKRMVSGLRIVGPGDYPATPTRVGVDLGTGKQLVSVAADGTVKVKPARTDRIVLSIAEATDLIDVNDLGFARQTPPGIAEIEVLPLHRGTVADPDLDRPISIDCRARADGQYGLGLSAAGRIQRLQVQTTARALRDGDLVVATPCPGPSLTLKAGEQEVSVNPGAAFTVESVELHTGTDPVGTSVATDVTRWDATSREVRVASADQTRVLSVPESTNPGWRAHLGGTDLTPVVVNGWQQGWVIPAGVSGTVALTYDLDTPYRWVLLVGLTLVALVFVITFLPRSRTIGATEAPKPTITQGQPGAVSAIATGVAGFGAAYLLTGWWGVLAATVTTLVVPRLAPTARVAVTFGAMALATVALASGAWHSGSPYAGYDVLPQLAALVAVSAAVATTVDARFFSRWINARRQGSSTKA